MQYDDRIDTGGGIDPTKSNINKECRICHISFLIMDSNFKIMYAIVAIISQCLVLI